MKLRAHALLLVLVACTPTTPGREPPPSNTRAVAVQREPIRTDDAVSPRAARMADHFADAALIKDAVIDGDLRAIRAPARRLKDDPGPYPEPWRAYVAVNTSYAAALLAAEDRHVAGVAAAGLANTCGDCHDALGVGPAFEPPHDIPASSRRDVLGHMHRHQWAADRMWEALIDRSEYAWMAGAVALVDAPLPRAELTRDVELPDEVLGLGAKIHDIGALAGSTVGWDARAGLYGQFLATCAGCHKGGC